MIWGGNSGHSSVQFRHSVVSDSVTPQTAACQASLSITNYWSLLKLISIHSTMSSAVIPFSCLQSFPASGSFPMSWLFASGGQSTGDSASTSVLPMTIQGWFPLGWTGLIFLHSKGHSKVLITVWNTTSQFESISSSVFSLLYGATLTSVHNYWKNHSFDFTDLYRQSNVSAF